MLWVRVLVLRKEPLKSATLSIESASSNFIVAASGGFDGLTSPVGTSRSLLEEETAAFTSTSTSTTTSTTTTTTTTGDAW